MDYRAIRDAFDIVAIPDVNQRSVSYSTTVLGANGFRIGKSKKGNPVLFVPSGSPQSEFRDRHLANLRVRHQLNLRLAEDQSVGKFSVVECLSQDEAVRDWFLRLLPSLYEQVQAHPPEEVLDQEIAKVAELFRVISGSTTRQLAGLWAEMSLIVRCADPRLMLESWHPSPGAVYDFTNAGFNVEVKATEGVERRHRFAAHQLRPSGAVIVASFVLRQADRGDSVMDLYTELIRVAGSDPDLQYKVNSQVGSAVGLRVAEAESLRFDSEAAAGSVALVRGECVPQPAQPFPSGVTDVRFVADLGLCPQVDLDYLSTSELWRSLQVISML
jgi:hypothetical protein